MNNEYIFFFVGGSCGSFVSSIFHYYLYKMKKLKRQVLFNINSLTGDCHDNNLPQWYHYLEQLDLTKKIIAIDFDADDKTTIVKMAFHKVVINQIKNDPTFLKTRWNLSTTDFDLLEKIFIRKPHYLIFPDWKMQLEKITPVLTIKFKDILYGNLNEIIANFLGVSQLPEVDQYIDEYRAINKKYIDIA